MVGFAIVLNRFNKKKCHASSDSNGLFLRFGLKLPHNLIRVITSKFGDNLDQFHILTFRIDENFKKFWKKKAYGHVFFKINFI